MPQMTLQELQSEPKSLKWRIRFLTADGSHSFVTINKKGGFELGEHEVQEWAEFQLIIHSDRYSSVDEIYIPD